MNNKEILIKAIEKAVNNGWNKKGYDSFKIEEYPIANEGVEGSVIRIGGWWGDNIDNIQLEAIIFNKDFAKAFWGEKGINKDKYADARAIHSWQFHLQQMVLESEPLKYLERFLNE